MTRATSNRGMAQGFKKAMNRATMAMVRPVLKQTKTAKHGADPSAHEGDGSPVRGAVPVVILGFWPPGGAQDPGAQV